MMNLFETEQKMKKAIRIIIPIVLVLITLLCTVWYLFVYDREFTRDMLLSCARYSESQGKHDIAAWFYDRAYTQSGDNDAVAIELAEQYKASGNYTKAEFTLSNAIADGGGIDLYVALCKTYVEQNKLLDAVTMLSSVTNPQIKDALDTMRPAVPAVSQEPGFYSQYISVGLSCESGTLYASADGTYPSVLDDPYEQPILLSEGENTILALTVGENGLVSPLGIFGYTIGGVIEEVSFTDPAMELAIREALGVDEEKALFTNDVWAIESFTVPSDAGTYDDLKYMPYLKELTIENGPAQDLSVISSLSELEKLSVTATTVIQNDLTAIAALPQLKELTLNNCGLSGITALSAATNVVKLDLSNNTVRNIAALSEMKGLQELNLDHNVVEDLSALSSAKTLSKLSVSYNALTSLGSIGDNSALTWLEAGHNSIDSLGQLQKLNGLTHLDLSYNALTDASPVAACSALTELDLSNNSLTDISSMSALTKLTYFNFSTNQITTIPQWPTNCALVTIDGSHNLIESVDALTGLEQLNNVYMDYNEALTSVESLAECPMLIRVDIYGTKVTDVSALTYQSIIVNYNPVQ